MITLFIAIMVFLFLHNDAFTADGNADGVIKNYIDRNEDGKIDLVIFEKDNKLFKKEIDFDLDGKFDKKYIYKEGKVVEIYRDSMNIGIPDDLIVSAKSIERNEELFKTVISKLLAELQNDENNISILLRLGNIYKESGDWNKAMELYKKAYLLDKDNTDVLFGIGECYEEYGDIEKAIGIYGDVIEKDKHYINAYNKLGNLYYEKRLYDKSIQYYKEALNINPSDKNAHGGLAAAYSEKGMQKEASAEAEKFIK